jgi:hypothetical protein
VPDAVLSQLGLKVQHALRAFTAKDRKEIKQVAENYPLSEFYNVDQTLTQLGIGEAFVTVLNEKGIPTPLVHCLLCPPQSRMDVLNESEVYGLLENSKIVYKYNRDIDRDSAYEILTNKINPVKKDTFSFEEILKSPVTNTVIREVTRGLLGILGFRTTTRRRR